MKQGDETKYGDDITYRRVVQREFRFSASFRPRSVPFIVDATAPHRASRALPRGHGGASSCAAVPQRVIESRHVALTARIAYPIIRSLTEQLIGRWAFAHLDRRATERTGDSQ
ncbi:hypothetical protein [Burkholderia cenocepacia]|uniref:hypothetical protein n=1 Tax=Burkholderia cenocepacia TaxID=95486 RepID=UPI0012B3EC61|nr:hypothetical protein [Burkholderia cenocepacia]MBR7983757.1 hypothetical protein [Burkholderia cenocepacia]